MKSGKQRNLNLTQRKSGTRDKIQPEVVKFSLDEIKKHFEDSISDIEEQFKTIDLLESKDREKIDYILRSQIVFLGGSLDFYFHEITQFGIMQMYDEIWQETKPYKNLNIKLGTILGVLKGEKDDSWFIEFINYEYSKISLISYDSIEKAMNMIGLHMYQIANKIYGEEIERKERVIKLKERMNRLCERRNCIAHQFDMFHENAEKKPIHINTVREFIEDAKEIVDVVYELMLEHDVVKR
ncbi:HEPN domain-containing protein [Clostridium sp. 1001270J_160509_D11]|uniref:HEPN domain-containing protein n=1 Tax=Clostridium sp. 1001270J_160509_D11 TaxID=2787103 RepID=UPI0018AB3F76|nr:HEPN domain-containing protein [Clostridium sp. 1001270J_160509_D11]